MKSFLAGAMAFGLVASVPAFAADGMALAKEKQCLSCHSVDKDMIGPSFKNIAERFRGLKNAPDMLVDVVMKGSASSPYHWGDTKMPSMGARVPVTQVEALKLVEWILDQK